MCESSRAMLETDLEQKSRLRTWWWIILQQLQKLDLYPRTRDLVVKVTFGALVVDDYPFEPIGGFDVAPLVLVLIVLDQCRDQGRDGKRNAHVGVVH